MNPTVPLRCDTFTEPASRFHGRDLLADPTPRVVECRSSTPAIVLGSVQRFDVVDGGTCERRGVEVVRRRSGGGAVLVEPDTMVWFDVVVPADDPRFVPVASDVTKSMRWIGQHLQAALTTLGVADVSVHEGPMDCADWCRLICFAGIAPGEVVLGDRKLVGISQRRSRSGARFQCAVHTRWSPGSTIDLLVPPRPAVDELPGVATVEVRVAQALPAALVAVLDAP